MVVGALAIRSRMDDNSHNKSQVLRLTCATELDPVCQQLHGGDDRVQLTVEAAGVTAARLEQFDGDPRDFGMDGWLVTAAWPSRHSSRSPPTVPR
jgi:hypothetical protein